MARKNALRASREIADKIPYLQCYEEEGMIETAKGVYTKTYTIEDVKPENVENFDEEILIKNFSILLNNIPDNMECQFVVHNRVIKKEDYLKKILLLPQDGQYEEAINLYNQTLAQNMDVGHNNTRKNTYFILSVHTNIPDEAVNQFRAIDEKIRKLFFNIYHIKATGLTCSARLKTLYTMFNPGRNLFGHKADLKGTGEFSMQNMSRMRLTSKDMIAPLSIKNYDESALLINDDTYVRTFFITCLPDVISSNFVSDITSVSSNMIYSMQMRRIDSKTGFQAVTDRISGNTIVKSSLKMDTLKDRREKNTVREEIMLHHEESAYFDREALNLFKESVASSNKTMMCTFVIAIYADTIENLNRDTKLLKISCNKFAAQLKCLYNHQLEGLQSVLPLCINKIDAVRVLNTDKLSYLQPLNIMDILKKDGLFNGLNAINDNLVLLNRKNNTNYAGLIAGTEYSGKTFQNKREIFNALVSTKDMVVILANNHEYDDFVARFGGRTISNIRRNCFSLPTHYGIIKNDRYCKSIMLEALLDCLTKKKLHADDLEYFEKEEEIEARNNQIENEVKKLLSAQEQKEVDFENPDTVSLYVHEHSAEYEYFDACIDKIVALYHENGNTEDIDSSNRLNLINFNDKLDLLSKIEYLYIKSIELRKQNITTWIFIDSIDEMFSSDHSALYLTDLIQRENMIKIPTTFVVSSTVKLLAENNIPMRLTDFLRACGYFKLMNQGVIERRFYTQNLNIPSSLEPYITNVEPGKGIIITSASNVAFDDNFEAELSAFYQLFI